MLVLMYQLLRQSIKSLLTLLCCDKYLLPPGCATYHKLFSVLEIIAHGELSKRFTYTIAYKLGILGR